MNEYIITPQQAKERFLSGQEYAVLDVREQKEFSRNHILVSSCAPLSRIELMVHDLVPCKNCYVILVDSGTPEDTRAQRAQKCLEVMGYACTVVLHGGMQGWRESGMVEFDGVGALSKGFGEYVELNFHTTRLEPLEVKALMESGEKFVVLDVRPREEYHNMNIPGSLNVPGCEITNRIADLVPDPETTIIINCAGRTRSIIGTQTLLNAGVPNRIAALKGGTMNWQLAGLSLEYATNRATSSPSAEGLLMARERSAAVAKKCDVRFIDGGTLSQWQGEAARKTLYVFDVRQPEEFIMGHLPGSRNAPGGQLVQATDEYAAVRNARYVFVDDTEVRAVMTAHWLNQMGLPEVYVLKGGLAGSGLSAKGLKHGQASPGLPEEPEVARITCVELSGLSGDAFIINVGASTRHRQGHIPGAAWVPRCYLERAQKACSAPEFVVLTADTPLHAAITTKDAVALWPSAQVYCLAGGTEAWTAAGLPMEEGMPWALAEEIDVWYKPYTDINAKPEAMQSYFEWEFGLVENIEKDGVVKFKIYR